MIPVSSNALAEGASKGKTEATRGWLGVIVQDLNGDPEIAGPLNLNGWRRTE